MAKEYIEREALFAKTIVIDGHRVVSFVDVLAIPAADVVEVVHGRWYWDADNETGHNIRRCSVCHSGSGWAFNYCPNCGARMDGE